MFVVILIPAGGTRLSALQLLDGKIAGSHDRTSFTGWVDGQGLGSGNSRLGACLAGLPRFWGNEWVTGTYVTTGFSASATYYISLEICFTNHGFVTGLPSKLFLCEITSLDNFANSHEGARHTPEDERLCREFHANCHEAPGHTPEHERLSP